MEWWARVWRDDCTEPVPLLTWTECWLREHAPICDAARRGARATTGWATSCSRSRAASSARCSTGSSRTSATSTPTSAGRCSGCSAAGTSAAEFLVGGLLSREEFLEQYEKRSGRAIDPEKLHYYELLGAWKCAVMQLGPGVRVPLGGQQPPGPGADVARERGLGAARRHRLDPREELSVLPSVELRIQNLIKALSAGRPAGDRPEELARARAGAARDRAPAADRAAVEQGAGLRRAGARGPARVGRTAGRGRGGRRRDRAGRSRAARGARPSTRTMSRSVARSIA